jgi:hypothetical protein
MNAQLMIAANFNGRGDWVAAMTGGVQPRFPTQDRSRAPDGQQPRRPAQTMPRRPGSNMPRRRAATG